MVEAEITAHRKSDVASSRKQAVAAGRGLEYKWTWWRKPFYKLVELQAELELGKGMAFVGAVLR